MKKYIIFLGSTLSLLVCSCGSPSLSSNCPDNVSVNVKMSEQPIFYWDPSCNPDGFAVWEKLNGHIIGSDYVKDTITVWVIEEDARPISTPITYGVTPEGLSEIFSAAPLEKGKGYRAEVLVYAEDSLVRTELDPQRFDSVGEVEFIYAP